MAIRVINSVLVACLILALNSAQARYLFDFEKQVLTREYVASLPEDERFLFSFDDQSDHARIANTTDKRCRYDPSHNRWPSEKAWSKLQKQLSSPDALIAVTPQASVCYGSSKNDAKCQELAKNWTSPYMHLDDPTEPLSPIYQGLTCQPPSVYDSKSCTLGGYPAYAIRVKTVSDIQSAINFARNDYIRLVIKNTGHDLAGKSLGYGALSVWTHGLKDLQYFDNVDESGYRGAAIKVGAGVQTLDLYKFANQKGAMVVAGKDPTVGFTGGYVQGGGHSPLSSIYGMAADHVLGFEVVTPLGEFLSATATTNQDLFWALRGGGGGTFGVVTSVTVKAYKDLPIAAASWSLDSSRTGKDRFWAATRALFDRAIDHADAETSSYFMVSPTGQDFTLTMQPMLGLNKTAGQLNNLLATYFSKLTSLNIPLSPKITEYKGFYPAWQAEFQVEAQSDTRQIISSRLIPRSNLASETGRNATFNVFRQTIESGVSIKALNIKNPVNTPDNAINAVWRNAIYHIITVAQSDPKASTNSILNTRSAFTNGTMQKWRDITPSSGAYMNEADRLEPNWQNSFWGDSYQKLLQTKQEMDPRDTFWAHHAVGSEAWHIETFDSLPNENGKLCKVQ